MAPLPPRRRSALVPEKYLILEKYLVQILFKLPAKSLLRFKCVSRSWFCIISHPRFRERYYAIRASSSIPRFFFQCSNFDYDPSSETSLHRFATLDSSGLPIDALPIRVIGGPIKFFVPSSRGLLCFATGTCVYLCNPTTHSLIQLPPLHGRETIAGFGFGYVESTGEYKVVRLVHKGSEGYYVPCKLECSVFTYPATQPAVTNAWKVLADTCPYFVSEYGMPAFVRGTESIYWKIDRGRHCDCRRKAQGRQDDFLVYLDLKEERFGVVSRPPRWRPTPGIPPKLMEAELTSNLSMVEAFPHELAVWFLIDQHQSHWVRHAISLPPVGIVLGEVKELKSQWMVFSSPDNVMVFVNPKNRMFKKVGIPPGLNMDFCPYTENLLTLRLPP